MVRSVLTSSVVIEVLSDRPVSLNIPWANKKRISVDVLGRYKGQMVVVEYDGSYYHSPGEVIAKDHAKTLALLDAGYMVVRLRENKLPLLEIAHPRLMQTSFRYRDSISEGLTAAKLRPVLRWIQDSARENAA